MADKIPDVWYDLYARMIPGVLLLAGASLVSGTHVFLLPALGALGLVVAGYFVGHAIQPLNSTIASNIDSLTGMREAYDRVKGSLPNTDRDRLILSKMGAETVSMCGCAVACVVVLVVQALGLPINYDHALMVQADGARVHVAIWILCMSIVLFLAFAIERSYSANKRARKLLSRLGKL